jgi:hypothetical protein
MRTPERNRSTGLGFVLSAAFGVSRQRYLQSERGCIVLIASTGFELLGLDPGCRRGCGIFLFHFAEEPED